MAQNRKRDGIFEKGLPADINAEKFLLGSVLLDGNRYSEIAAAIQPDMFSLEKHKRIWSAFSDLSERGSAIDRITLASELDRRGELESVDGLSYLVSLDDGLPRVQNIDSYVGILAEKFRLRQLLYIAGRITAQVQSGEFRADEVLTNAGGMLSAQPSSFGSNNLETVDSFIRRAPGGINRVLDPSTWDAGIPTGFELLDEWTDGFHAGEIFIVAARPGHGKTAWASAVTKNVARQGNGVAVFSLELSKQMFLSRMFCEEAYINYSRWRAGGLTPEERQRLRMATEIVMGLPIMVSDASGATVPDIGNEVKRMEQTQEISLIVMDYAQLVKPVQKRFSNENEKFTAIGEDIKGLAKRSGKPILLLSQLTRESEKQQGDNRPKIAQARGAGVWEEIAFVGACLYREWLRKRERDDLRNYAELLIEKNRSGQAGTVPLNFTPWLMRFSNPSRLDADVQPEANRSNE
jgi:replicative DNA helicase